MSSIHSGRSTPLSSMAPSRTPSPFEIQQARKIIVHNPDGGIEMVHLSSGVQDAFARARRDLDTPSPLPSPPQSRSSSPAASLRTVRSIGSVAPIMTPPPAEEETKEFSRGKKICVMVCNVMAMLATLTFFSSMIYLGYIKAKKD